MPQPKKKRGKDDSPESDRLYGKYRGICVDNVDPLRQGRIRIEVPEMSAMTSTSWAMPCFPVAGIQSGVFAVPPVGAGVWVEFEAGDPDYPIWVGGYYGSSADVPGAARAVPTEVSGFVIQTALENSITVSDAPEPNGGILIATPSGARISVNDSGIEISNGKGARITLIGPSVSINNGALAVI
ncbi:baseplate assembly protein [Intrasporangium chromatireducens Q5-1]|uniref:Baseplate assembly protein n=1 Tax=Intrasporangium chromatireducens Q5-1 TaxID=584657 RepID=W9GPD5_9MICO|nr:phage baseplate assembly protein V [Intrasporangium chromatireducens]EWT07985.1 baseplate assembly protein [Intrasporangium chromatireducens Q5-1]